MKLKRLTACLVLLCLVVNFLPPLQTNAATVTASGSCGENVTWTLTDDGTMTISGTGDMFTNLNSSEDVPWFDYRSTITTAVVEEGVTNVGSCAFYRCENLTNVILADSVTTIDFNAFSYCSKLESLTIPAAVTLIDESICSNCDNLTAVYVDDTNQYYCDVNGVLFNKSMTTLLCLPGGYSGAYTIPDTVTRIGWLALAGCQKLTDISIPDSVTFIGGGAFSGCTSLMQIDIPDSITYIGNQAFHNSGWYNAQPDGVVYMENFACETKNLNAATVELREGTTYICENTFCYNTALTQVAIPQSMTYIGPSAFYACSNLATVIYCGSQSQWNGVLVEFFNDPLLNAQLQYHDWQEATCTTSKTCAICGDTEGDVQHSWDEADCNTLKSCTVCGLVSDEYGHVWGEAACTEARTCTVCGTAESAARGHSWMDATCTAPKTCSVCYETEGEVLSHNWVGDTCTACGALGGQCGENVTWLLTDGILTISGTGAMVNFFEWQNPWYANRRNVTRIVIEPGVTAIGEFAFEGLDAVTSVTIPDTVTTIGQCAFGWCSGLTQIQIPDSVTQMGFGALLRCSSLTEVKLPEGLTQIDHYMFYGCTALQTVEIPDSVVSIGCRVFTECSSLQSVTIPEQVKTLDEQVFEGCTSLTQLAIPDSVTKIAYAAFRGCAALQELNIPQSVNAIGDRAFESSGVTGITFEGDAPAMEAQSFLNVTATAYYPQENTTWTEEARQNYGGTLTWEPFASVIASGSCGDGVTWRLDYKGNLTVAGSGAMEDYQSAEERPWHSLQDQIVTVTIESGITKLGNFAFAGCSQLQSITFVGDAPAIGEQTFTGVTANAYYPQENASWTANLLQNYGGSLTWEAYQRLMASGSCGDNLSWTLDEDGILTVSGAGEMTEFWWYGNAPWYDYADMISAVVVEEGVTSVSASAFSNCRNLVSVTLPDGLLYIGDYAFAWCSSLAQIAIPDSVTEVREYAFAGCRRLTSVTISDSVSFLRWGAFADCTGLTTVHIGSGMQQMSGNAFENCTGLTDISVAEDNPYFCDVDGVVFNKEMTTLVSCPGGYSGAYTVPEGVVTIGEYAFAWCSSLTSITLPATVTNIDSTAFQYCSCPIYVADGNASYCSENGTLFSKDKTVLIRVAGDVSGNYEIPDTVTTIYGYAFAQNMQLTNITIPDSVTSMGYGAFSNCYALTSAVIGQGVTEISESAFYNCSSLTSVTIPGTVTTIGFQAFSFCSGLTELVIPYGVTSIEGEAFWECRGLTSVTIPNSVTSIGSNAFAWCMGLTSVEIPDSVTNIDQYAFFGCNNLQSLTIGTESENAYAVRSAAAATIIGDYAFGECGNLSQITFKGDAPTISSYAFQGITATAYYPAENETWTEEVRQNYGGTLTWVSTCEHVWTEATCTEPAKCSVCGATTGEAAAHSYETVVTEPTCTSQGYTTHTCTVCGQVTVTDYVDAVAHSWGDLQQTVAPTCTEEGQGVHFCTACGAEETVSIAQLAHTHVSGVCSACGHVLADAIELSGDGRITVFDAQILAEAKAGLRELTAEQWEAIGILTPEDILDYVLGRYGAAR